MRVLVNKACRFLAFYDAVEGTTECPLCARPGPWRITQAGNFFGDDTYPTGPPECRHLLATPLGELLWVSAGLVDLHMSPKDDDCNESDTDFRCYSHGVYHDCVTPLERRERIYCTPCGAEFASHGQLTTHINTVHMAKSLPSTLPTTTTYPPTYYVNSFSNTTNTFTFNVSVTHA